jgi:hypothetical protein
VSATSPDGQPPEATFPLKDFQPLFLYPFCFAQHELKKAIATMKGAEVTGRSP